MRKYATKFKLLPYLSECFGFQNSLSEFGLYVVDRCQFSGNVGIPKAEVWNFGRICSFGKLLPRSISLPRRHLFPSSSNAHTSSTYTVMLAKNSHLMTFKQRPLHNILAILTAICFVWVTIKSYHAFAHPEVNYPPRNNLNRVAKVSMLYGEPNHMYERALQSHERHGKIWGYPMHVLRQDISVGFWNKPSYLLSLVIAELAKPAGERMEWLM